MKTLNKRLATALSLIISLSLVMGDIKPAQAAEGELEVGTYTYSVEEYEALAAEDYFTAPEGFEWDIAYHEATYNKNILACTEDEHTHADAEESDCMGWEFTCETEEHAHDDDCYALTCNQEEHEHTDECYKTIDKWFLVFHYTEKVLKCEKTVHTHDADCYTLACDKAEHTHSDYAGECYTQKTCDMAEHSHTDECYEKIDAYYTCTLYVKNAANVEQNGTTATITFTVKDADGKAIPNATVKIVAKDKSILRIADRNDEYTAVTDASGKAVFTLKVTKWVGLVLVKDGYDEIISYKVSANGYESASSRWGQSISENTIGCWKNKVNKDITLKANEYTVNFLDINGEVIESEQIAYGQQAFAPKAPEVAGMVFTGWDKSFKYIVEDTDITAQYVPATFTVKFLDINGEVIDTQTVNNGEAAVAPEAPTVEGHVFAGWDKDFSAVTGDIDVNALYDLSTYTVRFFGLKGESLGEDTVCYGYAAEAPEAPEYEDMTFIGWDKSFDVITENTDVTALYSQDEVYSVTFKTLTSSFVQTFNKTKKNNICLRPVGENADTYFVKARFVCWVPSGRYDFDENGLLEVDRNMIFTAKYDQFTVEFSFFRQLEDVDIDDETTNTVTDHEDIEKFTENLASESADITALVEAGKNVIAKKEKDVVKKVLQMNETGSGDSMMVENMLASLGIILPTDEEGFHTDWYVIKLELDGWHVDGKTTIVEIEKPVDEEPIDEEPIDEEPIDEEPIDEEPIDEEPIDEEPIDEEPTDEEPVDEEPIEEEKQGEEEVIENEPKYKPESEKLLDDKEPVNEDPENDKAKKEETEQEKRERERREREKNRKEENKKEKSEKEEQKEELKKEENKKEETKNDETKVEEPKNEEVIEEATEEIIEIEENTEEVIEEEIEEVTEEEIEEVLELTDVFTPEGEPEEDIEAEEIEEIEEETEEVLELGDVFTPEGEPELEAEEPEAEDTVTVSEAATPSEGRLPQTGVASAGLFYGIGTALASLGGLIVKKLRRKEDEE